MAFIGAVGASRISRDIVPLHPHRAAKPLFPRKVAEKA